jgi:hypothetical protein
MAKDPVEFKIAKATGEQENVPSETGHHFSAA